MNITNDLVDFYTDSVIAVGPSSEPRIAYTRFFLQPGAPDGVAADVYYVGETAGSFGSPEELTVGGAAFSMAQARRQVRDSI